MDLNSDVHYWYLHHGRYEYHYLFHVHYLFFWYIRSLLCNYIQKVVHGSFNDKTTRDACTKIIDALIAHTGCMVRFHMRYEICEIVILASTIRAGLHDNTGRWKENFGYNI